jgi:hypothetical protein
MAKDGHWKQLNIYQAYQARSISSESHGFHFSVLYYHSKRHNTAKKYYTRKLTFCTPECMHDNSLGS